jgi:RHS repeat-associated protein
LLAAFEYDAHGRRTKLARGDGTSTTYALSDTSTLSSLTMALAGNSSYQVAGFTRDLAGRITNRSSSNSAFEAAAPGTSSTTTYGNNGLNQVETITGAPNLAYDDRGNTTSQGGVAQTFDIANRMLTAENGAVGLAYDAAGRLREYASTSTTQFLYDGSDMIAEYDASGNVLRRYVHGPGADEPIVWFEGAGHSGYGTADRRYLTADERGSIVAVTSGTGSVLAINTYDDYGNPSTTSATYAGRFRYTGQVWLADVGGGSSTGLYYYKARIYSPSLGRFLQADPIGYGDGLKYVCLCRERSCEWDGSDGHDRRVRRWAHTVNQSERRTRILCALPADRRK